MSNIKIFSTYYKPSPYIQSDIVTPIQGGGGDIIDLGIIRDNNGDSISDKNAYYGELTVWYWVWKNYLSIHPEVQYIGFCHYRRFLDLTRKPSFHPLTGISYSKYMRNIVSYQALPPENSVYAIENYDIILPKKLTSKHTMEEKYAIRHHKEDFTLCKKVVADKYPEYIPAMESVCARYSVYHYLTFVMRKELFEDLAQWMFTILFTLEKYSRWEEYTSYDDIRTPAYLAERFFNVWLEYQIKCYNYKILHRKMWLLRDQRTVTERVSKLLISCIPSSSVRKSIRNKMKWGGG